MLASNRTGVPKLICGLKALTRESIASVCHGPKVDFLSVYLSHTLPRQKREHGRKRSPVEVLLHHFGDGARHGSLLGTQVAVQVHAQLLLQEVDGELGAAHLLLVVLDPRHLPLWRKLPVEVVLRGEGRIERKERKSGLGVRLPTGHQCLFFSIITTTITI